jgi:hypothetical protein
MREVEDQTCYGSMGSMGSDITITPILMQEAFFDTSPAMARRPRVFAPGLLYHVIVDVSGS